MTVQTFRKRPIRVAAMQWTGDNEDALYEFADGNFQTIDEQDRSEDPELTAEVFDYLHATWVGLNTGDWVIKGVKGEFYPINPDVLAETYEPVGGDA